MVGKSSLGHWTILIHKGARAAKEGHARLYPRMQEPHTVMGVSALRETQRKNKFEALG